MDLKDALVPFRPAGQVALQDDSHATSCTRVAFLSERLDLKAAMQRMLPAPRYVLKQFWSTELIEKAIEKRICDVVIVDIERQDEWPASVFSRFDEAAANFPIIILCKKRHDILNHLWKAQHATEIISYETVGDPRLPALIEAAIFRAEVTRDIGIGDTWDWTPPPAA